MVRQVTLVKEIPDLNGSYLVKHGLNKRYLWSSCTITHNFLTFFPPPPENVQCLVSILFDQQKVFFWKDSTATNFYWENSEKSLTKQKTSRVIKSQCIAEVKNTSVAAAQFISVVYLLLSFLPQSLPIDCLLCVSSSVCHDVIRALYQPLLETSSNCSFHFNFLQRRFQSHNCPIFQHIVLKGPGAQFPSN